MPLHLERVEWTQSPPLAPGDGPIDLDHLQRMTLGDRGLEREVLAMFSTQSARILGELAVLPPEAATHAHTLKGSARAIGAFGVAEAAAQLETALIGGSDPAQPLAALGAAIAEARTAIELILRRS
ncbi:Hpt domain-containing protein [Bradyrhizobium septentrionale]|uniref:Hpt domain-containing protein n=1 Tax=Bradyrhizobium septentrionale TaxID=1404411 RepID=A0A974A4F0_9BRAD|nr:Hpt domain-containing protein [Bradyrhizobium septentrionale]UGY15982.1 Hpt domain-containing protein [Bradyrhizobium septentrionale]UGY24556.1 Hpt domain-containing protein [Bradyrhizobium septentrionale]